MKKILLSFFLTAVFSAQAFALSSDRTLTAQFILNGSGLLTLPITTDTLVGRDTTDDLTNKTIDADLNFLSNISNAEISSSAAIDLTKLAALTASRAVVSDGFGFLSSSATTSTEIGYVSGVTSSIQAQINAASANGVLHVTGSYASPVAVTAVGGIVKGAYSRELIYIQGSGGPVTISANPQISAALAAGNELILVGGVGANTNTVTISFGNGTVQNGAMVVTQGATISYTVADPVAPLYIESSRNN